MKCMSCESEINPKWTHAIDNNICPFCGQSIMDEHLKELFSSMRCVMEELKGEYSDQLNDWMLSNYSFIKTDSAQLINYVPQELLRTKPRQKEESVGEKFTVKVKTEHGEQEILAEKIQSDEKTNAFFKRAEAIKPNIDGFKSTAEKTQKLKELKRQIEKAGATSGSFMMEDADPEDVAEMQGLLSEDEYISSALPTEDDDEVPAIVEMMANKAAAKNGTKNGVNTADLIKLQQMHDRIKNSHKNFESGENIAKGGFSRSG